MKRTMLQDEARNNFFFSLSNLSLSQLIITKALPICRSDDFNDGRIPKGDTGLKGEKKSMSFFSLLHGGFILMALWVCLRVCLSVHLSLSLFFFFFSSFSSLHHFVFLPLFFQPLSLSFCHSGSAPVSVIILFLQFWISKCRLRGWLQGSVSFRWCAH